MVLKYLEYDVGEEIAWIRINRPEQRNALCREALLELVDVFSEIDSADSVRAAILTGNGRIFVGGADLKEMVDLNAFEYMEFGNLYTKVNRAIRENSKPVIAAVNGHALGGGNVLMLSADIIVAAEAAKFALPEINIGIFGGAAILPGIIGKYRAAELVLLGETYTAQEAQTMGIVNKVVPTEELIQTVTDMAEKIKAKSPSAVKMAKKALLAGMSQDLNAATEYQLALMSMLYSGHDQKEGMRSFFEKRPPQFTGK